MKKNLTVMVLVSLTLGVPFLFSNSVAEGAEYCASSSLEIQNALTASGENNEDDLIKIVQSAGEPYVGNFVYNSTNTGNLTIEGGYTVGCSSRIVNPGNTVLDANGSGTVLNLTNSNILGNIYVEGLTLQNGS